MSKTYMGEVKDGVVVFDEGTQTLPNGVKARVAVIDEARAVEDLSRRLLELAGIAEGLPSDFAEQHDHYRMKKLMG